MRRPDLVEAQAEELRLVRLFDGKGGAWPLDVKAVQVVARIDEHHRIHRVACARARLTERDDPAVEAVQVAQACGATLQVADIVHDDLESRLARRAQERS